MLEKKNEMMVLFIDQRKPRKLEPGSLTQQQQPKGVIRTLLDWPELKMTKARFLKTVATIRWFQLQLPNN